MPVFANWIDQFMFFGTSFTSMEYQVSYGFITDGRYSYTKVSVNCFVLSLYVLTMFLLFFKYHIDGSTSLVQF